MYISSNVYSAAAMQAATTGHATGKTSPTNEVRQNSVPAQGQSYLRELAEQVDPTNMSRNDAWLIGDTLARSGESEMAMTFMAQGMILVEEKAACEAPRRMMRS